jgi:hypothetical protein
MIKEREPSRDAGVVEARAKIVEGGFVVVEQVPDDDEDGTSDRDDGAFGSSAPGDAAIAFAEEGVGASDGNSGFTEDSGDVAVSVAGGGSAFLLPG